MKADIRKDSIWIVVAAYNEAGQISKTLDGLKSLGFPILVVDDGSSDNTSALAQAQGALVFCHKKNQGQGAALRTGIGIALTKGASIIVTFDADGQMSAGDIEPLIQPILNGSADIALGTRFKEISPINMGIIRHSLLKMAVIYTRLSTGLSITDTHNGLRALSRKCASQLTLTHNRMAHASEFIEQIAEHGWRYQEVPVRIAYSKYSKRKGQTTLQLFRIIWDLLVR